MKLRILSFFLFTLAILGTLDAQTVPDSVATDTIVLPIDSLLLSLDSLPLGKDSFLMADSFGLDSLNLVMDSIRQVRSRRASRLSKVRLSGDSLDAKVDYTALDSMIYDIKNRKVYLYGTAQVAYQDLTIDAAYIEFDWASNIVTAEGRPDSTGRMAGNPDFKDKTQGFQAKKMLYNFKTRKGIIYNVNTKQGDDLYVLGAKAKFIGGNPSDTTSSDVVYSEDAIFTTCNHPEPHFGIRSNKQKVIPNKMVVVGPSNLEIGGVPTPIWLPFGFYPITKKESTGLIFPKDYKSDPLLGYGLEKIGWYFPLRDRVDLELTGDIYTRGTWVVRANSRYKTLYKYNGSILLEYADRKVENNKAEVNSQKAIRLNWSHNQDAKAHPYNKFSGSINIQTNGFQRTFDVSSRGQQQNSLSSNLSYTRRFANRPFNFSASFRHSQNTTTNKVTFNLPNMRFTTSDLYPFKRKVSTGGKQQWYEKITFNYTAEARNTFSTTDSTMFTRQTLESANTGIQQVATLKTNFKLFKYFNLTPQVSYSENWYLQSINKTFDPTVLTELDTTYLSADSLDLKIDLDTLVYGTVITDTLSGFGAFHNLKNLSVNLSTKIFGQMDFKKGKLRGLRHTMSPSMSFGYMPDYTRLLDTVDTDVRSEFNRVNTYTRFQNGFFDKPSTQGRSMRLGFSIGNTVEAKLFSKKDSTSKVVQLLQTLSLNSSYNYALDTLNFEDLSISARTKLFKGLTTVNGDARYSFYALEDNVKVNVFQWDKNRRPLRFVNANLRINTGMTLKNLQNNLFGGGKKTDRPEKNKSDQKQGEGPKVDGVSDILDALRLTHSLSFNWSVIDNQDTLTVRDHVLKLSIGNIQMTTNWSLTIDQVGYDFKRKGFLYPSLTVSRNLHCWKMGLSWQPDRGSFHFTLGVRPGTLEFIKVPYQKGTLQAPSLGGR